MLKLKLHLGPHGVKSRLIRKDPDAEKDCRQEEKGVTEDEMVGWHHWLNGQEFEQTLGDDAGQGSQRAAVHGITEIGHYSVTEQNNNIPLWKESEVAI